MSINPSLAVFIDLLLASPYYLLWAGSVAEFRAANNCISVGVLTVEAFSINWQYDGYGSFPNNGG